jgi:hypothetical protein
MLRRWLCDDPKAEAKPTVASKVTNNRIAVGITIDADDKESWRITKYSEYSFMNNGLYGLTRQEIEDVVRQVQKRMAQVDAMKSQIDATPRDN